MSSSIFDIATLGTSLTAGNAISRSWHSELRIALCPGNRSKIRTYNFGVGGTNIDDSPVSVAGIIKLRPRAIAIEYSMNDCHLNFTHARNATIARINDLKAGTPGSAIFLMIMNPVVGTGPSAAGRPNLSTFYQMYRDLSTSENVGLIDTTPHWAGVTLAEIPDGVHPLPETNRARLIPGIVSALAPLIT